MNYNENYKTLIQTILDDGVYQESRNGRTKIIPSYSFIINSKDWRLNLRKMNYKGVLGEYTTLMSKDPLINVEQFKNHNCNYWDMFAGENGQLNLDYWNELHPALEKTVEQIKTNPNSRRHVVSLWNNEHAFDNSLSLHCCWHNLTFSVIANTIHLIWTQRSCDVALGIPSDVYLAHLFLKHVSEETGIPEGTISFHLSNVHLYTEHLENAKELLNRTEADYDKPLKFKLL